MHFKPGFGEFVVNGVSNELGSIGKARFEEGCIDLFEKPIAHGDGDELLAGASGEWHERILLQVEGKVNSRVA